MDNIGALLAYSGLVLFRKKIPAAIKKKQLAAADMVARVEADAGRWRPRLAPRLGVHPQDPPSHPAAWGGGGQAAPPPHSHCPRAWGGDAFTCMRHVLPSAYNDRVVVEEGGLQSSRELVHQNPSFCAQTAPSPLRFPSASPKWSYFAFPSSKSAVTTALQRTPR